MLKRKVRILNDQSGVAMVIALIMIIVLTLIGLASTFTSTFEIKLSGNKRGATESFYAADGGAQSVVVNIANFSVPGNFVPVDPSTLLPELQTESIDSRFSNPTPSMPAGVNYTTRPQVTIYHTTRTSTPRGSGMTATGGIGYEHYVLTSVGTDQMDVAQVRGTTEIKEKVVRLIPTAQGGN